MARFGDYLLKAFSTSQNFLARDPANSGDVIRVNAQSVLDAAVAAIQDEGGIVLGIDTKTEALATDIDTGVYVVTGGDTVLFDGGGIIYRVSDPGSGGAVMANNNELVSIVDTNKQSYTATYSSNVLTVTPEINSTVFATEQAGLIIRVILPAMATTDLLQVNYNGSVRDVHWIDDSVTASGDVDSTYNKELLLRDNGTDWLIISDVSGGNANGNWEKKSNGDMVAYSIKSCVTNINIATGAIFTTAPQIWVYPKAFTAIPSCVVGEAYGVSSCWGGLGTTATTNLQTSFQCFGAISVMSTPFASLTAVGRWY